ncbi:MAG: DUF333 domain-containing protein [Methanoregulaceae archaeon]|nr:DUF333 domain-containing protein [Methanoregulaceae archaeon]
MTHRHKAVIILILSALLGMALLTAGCTRAPFGSETSVTVPADAISDPAAGSSMNMNNNSDIPKNPDGSGSGVSTLPDAKACNTSDNNQSTCPLPTTPEARNPAPGTQISNPAAAYCINMNNRLEIRINPDGSNSQICILADGTECDAIAYFEGTCPNAPAPEYTPVDETIVNPYEALCRSKNFTYKTKVRSDGSEHGVCIFPDGKECDAWDYYVGYCLEETALEP